MGKNCEFEINSGYDLVFVDPPYAFTEDVGVGSPLSGLLDLLQEQIAHDGLVVVRTSSPDNSVGAIRTV